jgi:hypothetical protein
MVQAATPDAAFRTNTFQNDTCTSQVDQWRGVGNSFEKYIIKPGQFLIRGSSICIWRDRRSINPQNLRILPSRILPYIKLSRIPPSVPAEPRTELFDPKPNRVTGRPRGTDRTRTGSTELVLWSYF